MSRVVASVIGGIPLKADPLQQGSTVYITNITYTYLGFSGVISVYEQISGALGAEEEEKKWLNESRDDGEGESQWP